MSFINSCQFRKQVCREFVLARYYLFNSNADQDAIDQVNDEYLAKFFEVCGVDPKEHSELYNEVKDLEEIKQRHEAELMEARKNYNEKLSKLEQMKQEIEEIESTDAERHHALKEKLNKLKDEKNTLIAKREAIRAENANVREAIKVQSCSYGRKKELLRNVNELKRDIEAKQARLDYLQTIRNNCNEKIDEEISKIYAAVKEWNNQIIPLSIEQPQLKEILIPETAFQRNEFLVEVKQALLKKSNIDKAISHEMECVERTIAKLQEEIVMVESDIESIERKTSQLQDKNQDLNTKVNTLNAEKRQQLQKWEEEKAVLELEHNKLLQIKSNDIPALEKNLLAQQEKVEGERKENQKLGEKSIALFVEIHKQVRDTYENINGIFHCVLEKMKKRDMHTIEEQRKILSNFEKIKKQFEEIKKCN